MEGRWPTGIEHNSSNNNNINNIKNNNSSSFSSRSGGTAGGDGDANGISALAWPSRDHSDKSNTSRRSAGEIRRGGFESSPDPFLMARPPLSDSGSGGGDGDGSRQDSGSHGRVGEGEGVGGGFGDAMVSDVTESAR